VALAEPPGPVAVDRVGRRVGGRDLGRALSSDVADMGAIESCVASVEFQLRVADSTFIEELGLACSVTVGRAAAGGGGGEVAEGRLFSGNNQKRRQRRQGHEQASA